MILCNLAFLSLMHPSIFPQTSLNHSAYAYPNLPPISPYINTNSEIGLELTNRPLIYPYSLQRLPYGGLRPPLTSLIDVYTNIKIDLNILEKF